MNLDTLRPLLKACRELMDVLYQKPVFDEWIVVSVAGGKIEILDYHGPRRETYGKQLHADSAPLVGEMQNRHYEVGDFEFILDASGTRFDAAVRLGETAYLLCNNTYGSMDDIRNDPRWRKAQAPFVDMTEKVRANPLV
jgi:hypothetical protein